MTTNLVIPGTDGLVTSKAYVITSLSTPDGSVYNLAVEDDGTVRTRPADHLNLRQQWQLVSNDPSGGYALFNPATGKYLYAPGGNQALLAVDKCGIDDTGFSIVGGNGSWVIRRQTNDGDNVEARGEAGDGAVVETWSWNGGPNQNWSFAYAEDRTIIPGTSGLTIGSTYVILSVASNDACGVTLEPDNSIKLQIANKNDPSQQWKLISNLPGTGIAFLNLATGKQWSAANSEGSALSGVAYQANAGTSDSGFQIGAIGENCWIRRTDNEHLHVDDFGANGQAGDTVGLWGWHGDGAGEFMWKFVKVVE
jgi:hypothetical protein